jgi:acyl carrier protein
MPEPSRSAATVRQDVLGFLAEYTHRPEVREARGDVLLKECGLDSFGTFELVVGLEKCLGLVIPDDLLDARRTRSVNGLVDLLLEAYARDGTR